MPIPSSLRLLLPGEPFFSYHVVFFSEPSFLVRRTNPPLNFIVFHARSCYNACEQALNRNVMHPKTCTATDYSRLGIPLTPCSVSKFLSLETSVQIHSSVRDEDVFIIQSPSPPAINDHLMELLIMISGTSYLFKYSTSAE